MISLNPNDQAPYLQPNCNSRKVQWHPVFHEHPCFARFFKALFIHHDFDFYGNHSDEEVVDLPEDQYRQNSCNFGLTFNGEERHFRRDQLAGDCHPKYYEEQQVSPRWIVSFNIQIPVCSRCMEVRFTNKFSGYTEIICPATHHFKCDYDTNQYDNSHKYGFNVRIKIGFDGIYAQHKYRAEKNTNDYIYADKLRQVFQVFFCPGFYSVPEVLSFKQHNSFPKSVYLNGLWFQFLERFTTRFGSYANITYYILTSYMLRRIVGGQGKIPAAEVEHRLLTLTASTRPYSFACSAFLIGRNSFSYGQCRVGTALKYSVRALSAVFDPIRYLATHMSVEPLLVAVKKLTNGGSYVQRAQAVAHHICAQTRSAAKAAYIRPEIDKTPGKDSTRTRLWCAVPAQSRAAGSVYNKPMVAARRSLAPTQRIGAVA